MAASKFVLGFALLLLRSVEGSLIPLRAPCTPLNVVSPYQSMWSCSDNLYDSWPTFWTGDVNGMYGMINVDGVIYRWMGPEYEIDGLIVPAVKQTNVSIGATTTMYEFTVGDTGVTLQVKFTTPSINLDDDSYTTHDEPITYVQFIVSSSSSSDHKIKIYMDITAESIVNNNNHEVQWSRNDNDLDQSKLLIDMKVGTTEQDFASSHSDRINWGYSHLAVPTYVPDSSSMQLVESVMNSDVTCRSTFANGISLSEVSDDDSDPRAANDNWIVLAIELDLSLSSSSSSSATASSNQGVVMLALDQGKSIKYFGTDLLPYWMGHDGSITAIEMLTQAATQVKDVLTSCASFDDDLIANHEAVGGSTYATLTSLVYRQTTGAIEKTWNPIANESWVFMKEISSDGDVSTIDVIYPASPFFLATNQSETLRRMLLPLLVYANNNTEIYGDIKPYTLPWAPHHLGVWPTCDLSQDLQEQMPMEESGNLLLMIVGVAYKQGWSLSSIEYLTDDYFILLNQYADYLVSTLPDPGDQLCTDDFEGASPHNANLAAKGIVALVAWSELLLLKNDTDSINKSKQYSEIADVYVGNWTTLDIDVDGLHYKMEYDINNTFSLKYNILYQEILDLPNKPFSKDVISAEQTYYNTKQLNEYGIPLDNRATFTKLDWSMWIAAMADTDEQFNAITEATFKFASECIDRVPLSDWTDTVSPTVQGFQARPVMGGIYAKLLV